MLSGTYFDFALNFALKMTKIFILYSNMIHQLVGVEGMLMPGEYCKVVQFGVYFDTICLRNIHLLHKNNDIVAKPLLGSPGRNLMVHFGVYLIKVGLK